MSQTSKAILSQLTEQQLLELAKQPPHAVLIDGARAHNADSAAVWFGRQMTTVHDAPKSAVIDIQANPLTISDIRNLRVVASQKGGAGKLHAIVVLRYADSMTIEAQNALLKVLEEPAEGVMYVLGANVASNLLATIRSRCREVALLSPSQSDYSRVYANSYDTKQFSAAFAASNGSVLRFNDYLEGNLPQLAVAKGILSKSTGERLMMCAKLSEQRESAIDLIENLQSLLSYLLEQAALAQDRAKIDQLTVSLETAESAKVAISKNANAKLQLDKLFVSL